MQEKDLSLVHKVLPASNPENEKPPLLLMLHGYGSHENDLFSMAPMLNEKCTVVSLRAPMTLTWGGFAWYEINFNALGTGKMSDVPQARESMKKILDFIPQAQQAYHTDPDQLWLMGFSQGSILSYGLSLTYPEKFNKIIALSGYVLKDLVPEKYKPAEISHLDYFISHGTQDEVLPVEWARQSARMLQDLKIRHQYHEYSIGHGVSPKCFEDLKNWMRDRKML